MTEEHLDDQETNTKQSEQQDDQLVAALAHAGILVSWMVIPALIYFWKKDDSKYIAFHALQAAIWATIGVFFGVLTFGIGAIIMLIYAGVGAWKVFRGEPFKYPFVSKKAQEIVGT